MSARSKDIEVAARLAREREVRELANTISGQLEAIATGTLIGPLYAAVQRIKRNVEQLEAITPDDRSGQ